MHKISLAVSSMIVTGFLMKSYRKLREKPEPDLDELHRQMRAAYARVRRRADVFSTPCDGGLMSPIDALQQMAPGRFM